MFSHIGLGDLLAPPWVYGLVGIGAFLYLTMIIVTVKMLSVWDGLPPETPAADWPDGTIQLFTIGGLVWPLVWFVRGAYVLGRVIVRGILSLMLPKPELPRAEVVEKRGPK